MQAGDREDTIAQVVFPVTKRVIGAFFSPPIAAVPTTPHSHSIVPGGFDVMS